MKKLILVLLLIAAPAWGQSLTFLRPITTQTLEVGAVSAQITNALGAYVRVVRLHPTVDAHVAIGSSPLAGNTLTATAADLLMPADTTEYFMISPGGYIAVIQDAATGVIYVTGMTR